MDERKSAPGKVQKGVGQTALGVARARSIESRRTDRFFADPLAEAFLEAARPFFAAHPAQAGEAGPPAGALDVRPVLNEYVAVRTRFFDEALLDACRAGVRQVVILGAGLDARAFRLPWPTGTHVFEVDLPDVFRFKEAVVAEQHVEPSCQRQVVIADLREDWPSALRSHGFRPERPTAWLMEGLLMYLGEKERDRLIERVSELSAVGSQMALEPPRWSVPEDLLSAVARGVLDQSAVARIRQMHKAVGEDISVADPARWLEQRGWQPSVHPVVDLFHSFQRAMSPETAALVGGGHRGLVTAKRV